jgi:hypothetical protein
VSCGAPRAGTGSSNEPAKTSAAGPQGDRRSRHRAQFKCCILSTNPSELMGTFIKRLLCVDMSI